MHTGSLTHCLRACPKLQTYRSDVLQEMEKIFGVRLKPDPTCLLLGLPSKSTADAHRRKLYNILTLCTTRNILLQWITDRVPSIAGWHRLIMEHTPLDSLTCLLHEKTDILDYIQII